MRHIFIVNPKAGKGNSSEGFSAQIESQAKKLGIDCLVHTTTAAYEGIDFVRETAKSGEPMRFYACGGDGTLFEVVNGIATSGNKNAEVAVIPLGSGNDFIRLFGKKEDMQDIAVHVNGTPVELDLIQCADKYAINQCSMGLDAEVCAMQASFKKIKFLNGESAYTAALLYSFVKKMKSTFTITVDDNKPVTMPVLFCFVGNSRWYGGGYMAAPKALPDDGLLDFIIVKKNMCRLKLLTLIGKYKAGKHLGWDITTFVRGKQLHITSEKPAAVNVDGETEYVTEATFRIIEKGIKFVVPSNSAYLKGKR